MMSESWHTFQEAMGTENQKSYGNFLKIINNGGYEKKRDNRRGECRVLKSRTVLGSSVTSKNQVTSRITK